MRWSSIAQKKGSCAGSQLPFSIMENPVAKRGVSTEMIQKNHKSPESCGILLIRIISLVRFFRFISLHGIKLFSED